MTIYFIFMFMIYALIGLTGWDIFNLLMIPIVLRFMNEYDRLTDMIGFLKFKIEMQEDLLKVEREIFNRKLQNILKEDADNDR